MNIFDDLAQEWREHHPHATQTPAATPVNLRTTTRTEEPMGFVTDVKNELAAAAHDLAAHAVQFDQNVLPGLAAKLEAVDEGALETLDAIKANPGAKAVFDTLASVLHVDPNFLQIAANTLADLGSMFPKPAEAPVAAAQ